MILSLSTLRFVCVCKGDSCALPDSQTRDVDLLRWRDRNITSYVNGVRILPTKPMSKRFVPYLSALFIEPNMQALGFIFTNAT